jgi:hypothetical protein
LHSINLKTAAAVPPKILARSASFRWVRNLAMHPRGLVGGAITSSREAAVVHQAVRTIGTGQLLDLGLHVAIGIIFSVW